MHGECTSGCPSRKKCTLQFGVYRASDLRVDLERPFIRLPYQFDPERLAEEVIDLPRPAWMAHPIRMHGNSAVALISQGGGDNDDFDGAMAETAHLERCPYTRQVLSSFGEVLARSRFMKLDAKAEVATHVDFNYHWYSRVRIHIPVITNPQVTFYCANESVHMEAGQCWIFNSWRRHRVTNDSDEDRVHLVIDLSGSSRFWAVVRDALQIDSVDAERFSKQCRFVPFTPDQEVSIRTERYNTAPVMAPGEVDLLVQNLLDDFEHHPKNDPDTVRSYKELLTGFAKDWREAWHLYGFEPRGRPAYKALIDNVYSSLDPNRRALVTQSNDIGVNPVIVQRILRSALAPERLAQFQDAGDSNS